VVQFAHKLDRAVIPDLIQVSVHGMVDTENIPVLLLYLHQDRYVFCINVVPLQQRHGISMNLPSLWSRVGLSVSSQHL
jgi:hypothetical protein